MGEFATGSLMGSTDVSQQSTMTGTQSSALDQFLAGLGPEANQAIMGLLQGGQMDQQQMNDIFQTAYVDPAMMNFEQKTLPAIQQRFVDANAGSSSALNQALGQSAVDLNTMLGGQMGNFYMGQQQMNQQGQLGALQSFQQGLGQKPFENVYQQKEGVIGPAMQAAAMGVAMSSREVKENIENYDHGLDYISKMEVKSYDYKYPFDGKNKVGLIAEDVPKELQADVNGILGVDLYGLLSTAINAIKELTIKVDALEAK